MVNVKIPSLRPTRAKRKKQDPKFKTVFSTMTFCVSSLWGGGGNTRIPKATKSIHMSACVCWMQRKPKLPNNKSVMVVSSYFLFGSQAILLSKRKGTYRSVAPRISTWVYCLERKRTEDKYLLHSFHRRRHTLNRHSGSHSRCLSTSSLPTIQHRISQPLPFGMEYMPLLFNGFHPFGNFTSGFKFLDSSF